MSTSEQSPLPSFELKAASLDDEYSELIIKAVPRFEEWLYKNAVYQDVDDFSGSYLWQTGVIRFQRHNDESNPKILLPIRLLTDLEKRFTVTNHNRQCDVELSATAFSLFLHLVTSNDASWFYHNQAEQRSDVVQKEELLSVSQYMAEYYRNLKDAMYDVDLGLSDEDKSSITSLID